MIPAATTTPFASAAARAALLIDDERMARDGLRWLLAAHAGYRIVGEAATFDEARTRLAQPDYDLVFLDIQLVGGSGFDLIPHVRREARTIFVTAFDRHALRAFEVNALDYLLKPVSPERFAASLARLGQPAGAPDADPAAAPLAADDTVFVRTDAGDHFVPVTAIAAVLSNLNYSDVCLRTGRRLFTRRTMKAWGDLLPLDTFVRVHRHALVNVACIERELRRSREALELAITGLRDPVAVSRSAAPDVLARLQRRR